MAITDNWHVHPGRDCCSQGLGPAHAIIWPDFASSWFGGEYPIGRGQQRPLLGWQCSGCGRGYAPHVQQCTECGPKTEQATSTNCCGPNGCEDAER